MDSSRPEADRRRYIRLPVDYPISYALIGRREVSAGMAMNVSEGGLLAYFFERMGIGTEIDLEMFYTCDLQFTALNAQARVVWKDIMETSEAIEYQYGIEFIRMDGEGRSRLRRLLASMRPPPSPG